MSRHCLIERRRSRQWQPQNLGGERELVNRPQRRNKTVTSNKSTRHHAPRIAVFNHKGGVGKTTLTVSIAAALGSLKNTVLLVDSDPQCNLTSYLVEEDV